MKSETQSNADSMGEPNPLEIVGMLAGRLVHDQANALACLKGNITLAQRAGTDAAGLADALESITEASGRLEESLREFSTVRQQAGSVHLPVEAGEIWRVVEALAREKGASFEQGPVPKRIVTLRAGWMAYALAGFIDAMAREGLQLSIAAGSESEFGPSPFPISKRTQAPTMLQIRISGVRKEAAAAGSHPTNPIIVQRLVGSEIFRTAGGWLTDEVNAMGRCEVTVLLPLAPLN